MWQRIKNCIHGNELVYAGPFSRSVVSYGWYLDIENWYIYTYDSPRPFLSCTTEKKEWWWHPYSLRTMLQNKNGDTLASLSKLPHKKLLLLMYI